MSNPNKLDLPAFADTTFPTLLDGNFSNYKLQKEGNAQVVVEKYAIKKDLYVPFFLGAIGSGSRQRPDSVLIKEDGFTDIGGGFATFLRHFARIPDPWFDYEQKSVLFFFQRFQGTPVGINYDYGCGQLPVGFNECGFLTGYARRNVTIQAKATRYYLTQQTLESYINNDFILPNSGASWRYSHLYPDAELENTFTTITQFGKPSSLPSYLFVNQPRVKTIKTNTNEMVMDVDSIKKWHGNIYELTRYTSQIQPNYAGFVDELTFQMEYRFEADVTESQRDNTVVIFASNSGVGVAQTSPETFFNLSEFSNPEEDQQETLFASVTQGGLKVKSVTTLGGTSTLSVQDFPTISVGQIVSTWNNTNNVVQLTVFIGNE